MASNYMAEYEKWLNSDVLTAEEHAELLAIQDDPKEIESRFYGPLELGTAGLRGTMKVGLHHMNTYVVRHATQGFANVIAAEGEEAARLLAALAQTDAVDKILASGDCVSLKTLAVSGRDFPLLRGPALGQMLNRLLEHVLQAPADNNRETLLELSKKFESPS